MAKHGFDAGKLKRNLDLLLSGWVDSGALPCVQALVNRNGEQAYRESFGLADVASGKPLAEGAIFRIYSMTKVFTSVAAMMLYEEGRFKMYDPLSKFIPEYKDVRVAVTDDAGCVRTVAPRREIVVRDLFTMASGLPYPGKQTPAERAMEEVLARESKEKAQGQPWDALRIAREVAKVPLAFHPGDHWQYGFSIDILGALVEVLSGQKLGVFMQERIFTPLGLQDTGFYVPPDKISRFVTMYQRGEDGAYRPADWTYDEDYFAEPAFESGGGGLVSTIGDVGSFAQMLLQEGVWEDKRLLSRKSVELMRTNHLSPRQLVDYDWDSQRGYGYGLGVRVMMHPEIAGYGNIGEFAWDGMAGTWFCVDPVERLTAVFLVQVVPGQHTEFVPNFAQAVYGAIRD